jgi:hypothetical protein
LPRQTRRARNQTTGTRKRSEPAIPRHFYQTAPTAPVQEPSLDVDDATEEPDVDSSVIARAATPTRFATQVATAPVARARPAASAGVASRLASTDYGYVVGELKRIFITAAIVVAMLLVVALVKR